MVPVTPVASAPDMMAVTSPLNVRYVVNRLRLCIYRGQGREWRRTRRGHRSKQKGARERCNYGSVHVILLVFGGCTRQWLAGWRVRILQIFNPCVSVSQLEVTGAVEQ